MKTVLILLDACRHDYIRPDVTPFLARAAEEGMHFQQVRPSAGFCERAEIFSGTLPETTGFFTAIGYDPERSPYQRYKPLLNLASSLLGMQPRGKIDRLGRRVLRKMLTGDPHRFGPYHIPFRLLPFFTLTEDYTDLRHPDAFSTPSLFDLLRQEGKSWYYDSFTALNLPSALDDAGRLHSALNHADSEHELYLIYNSVPDHFGHKFGPLTESLDEKLALLDHDLEQFTTKFLEKAPDTRFLFLGDHGMVQVKDRVDLVTPLLNVAAENGLKPGRDFVYFLDSTLLRLWFHNDKARKVLGAWAGEEPLLTRHGRLLDEALRQKHHLPVDDRRYGDLAWWANPGVLLKPDYFHGSREEVEGMHGYDPDDPDNQGMAILWGKGVQQGHDNQINLVDIYSVLKESLFKA